MIRVNVWCENIRVTSFLGHGDCIIQAKDVHTKVENVILTTRFIS
jgi:hypothetical protein